uniref:Uncharacterized protein n=1 Tax=Pelusios castaneus TaxID=367368 RepID=A0A8C8R6U7_9SAUR
MREKVRVRVDVIVQDAERNIPKWIAVAPRDKSKSLHVTCPWQELMGMTKSPTVDKITAPRHTPCLEKNVTGYDSFMEEYQSADEECSWSNVTLGDLYPGMVEALSKLMNKRSLRNATDSIIRYYKHRGWLPRKSKLNVTTERIRRFRSSKLKPVLLNTNRNDQKLPTGNNLNKSNTLLHDGKYEAQCVTNDESGVVSYTHMNTGEMEIDWSGNLEDNSYTQNISESVFPNAAAKTEETFLIESPSEIILSLHDTQGSRSGKLSETPSLRYFSVASSTSPYLVKEGKDAKIDSTTSDGTSGFHLSTCNLNGDATTFPPLNSSLVRKSNTLIRNPEIKTFGGCFSLQRSHSFSSLPVTKSPVKTLQKCEDEFEKLYQKLCPKELQKPLKFTRPPSNPKENEKLIKSYFGSSVKSHKKYDSAFDKVYQRLCSEGLPKLPTFMRASNLRKYEGIQMSETVNALINSPIRTLPAVTSIKRVADFHNEGLPSSPVKRLKNIPEDFFPRDSGFHGSSNHTFLVSPSTFVHESKIANGYASIPGTLQSTNGSSRSSQNYQQRVSRQLSYSDGREREARVF